MTKVGKNNVKCAVCGNESEQLIVYSVNYSMGTKEDNDKLVNSKQKCPKCGYENNDISKINYIYKENKDLKIPVPSYWIEYGDRNTGHPIFKFDPIGTNEVKVLFKFYNMVKFSPTIYGMYTIEKLGIGSKEIYDKEFDKIVNAIKNESNLYNIMRLSNIKIDDKLVKRIYIEYLNSKTVSIMDLVWINNDIYMFNCPICESDNINVVLENKLIKIENTIIKNLIITSAKQKLLDKIDDKIEQLKNNSKLALSKKEERLQNLDNEKFCFIMYSGSSMPNVPHFKRITMFNDIFFEETEKESKEYNDMYFILKVKKYLKDNIYFIEKMLENVNEQYSKSSFHQQFQLKIDNKTYKIDRNLLNEEGVKIYDQLQNKINEILK